ncbi:hypothetical protein HDV00_012280 [Rhizophlyctis rosea]|nr:hypothetical protein HDV00_012280 [Rhizophlyctis rosea]
MSPTATTPTSPPPNPDSPLRIYRTLLTFLDQLTSFVSSLPPTVSTPDGDKDPFIIASTVSPASTIGKHLRHILDHIRLLFDVCPFFGFGESGGSISAVGQAGLGGGFGGGRAWVVEYDKRIRDPTVESDRHTALKLIQTLKQTIQRVAHLALPIDTPVTTCFTLTPDEPDTFLPSTLGREAWFVAHHGIHHAALMKAICIEQLGIKVSDNFGVAPATVKHHFEHMKEQG